jgi:uncharacterized protein (DUF697 family)
MVGAKRRWQREPALGIEMAFERVEVAGAVLLGIVGVRVFEVRTNIRGSLINSSWARCQRYSLLYTATGVFKRVVQNYYTPRQSERRCRGRASWVNPSKLRRWTAVVKHIAT